MATSKNSSKTASGPGTPTTAAPAAAPGAAASADKAKPSKPDEELFLKECAVAEKSCADSKAKLDAISAKVDLAVPNRGQPSATQQRKQALHNEAAEIRHKQAGGKNDRLSKQDQIKRLEEQLRARVVEDKAARAKLTYQTLGELNAKIDQLEAGVNGGRMKLVDEKRNLDQMSTLRKLRRSYSTLDDSQKRIVDLRAEIKEVKDSLDSPGQKTLGERYNAVQAELDVIKAEAVEAYKGISQLREERSRLQAEHQECLATVRRIKDDYYGRKKAFGAWEVENRARTRQRIQEERERQVRERRRVDAERVLADASIPAYSDEIRRAIGLIQFLDPGHPAAATHKKPLLTDMGLGAQASRTVDDSGLTGVRLVRKKDREEDYMPAKRSNGKKKNLPPTTAAATSHVSSSGLSVKTHKFPPIEDCSFLQVDMPTCSADVPKVINQIVAKLDHWKADQIAQTQRNIEKAKKDVEKFDREGTPTEAVDDDKDSNHTTDKQDTKSFTKQSKTVEAEPEQTVETEPEKTDETEQESIVETEPEKTVEIEQEKISEIEPETTKVVEQEKIPAVEQNETPGAELENFSVPEQANAPVAKQEKTSISEQEKISVVEQEKTPATDSPKLPVSTVADFTTEITAH